MRLHSRPVKSPRDIGSAPVEPLIIAARDFLKGWIPDADPLNIPNEALTTLKNYTYMRGQLLRRNGYALYGLAKPNSNKIMAVYAFYHVGTGISLLRFTPSTIHKATATGWEEITPNVIAANSGGEFDFFSLALADNRVFFSNNGVDPIREIDPSSGVYKALGNAPRYKYITSAFNRIVGAYLVDATNDPTEIGWSGDLNYGVWDSVSDFTAGYTPLVDSPSDTNDDITGLFNMSNNLVIPRQRSIWLGQKQPSATQPFYFFPGLPRQGADTPRTICLTDYGLIWFDYATTSINIWNPGTEIEEVGAPIRRTLRSVVDSPTNVWASYSHELNTYTIYVGSNSGGVVKCFAYNLEYKNWSYNEYPTTLCEVADIDFTASQSTINDLSGTIDDLSGLLDQLGGLASNSTRFFGFTDGELATDPAFSGLEVEEAEINITDDTTAFTSECASKLIEVPLESMMLNLVRVEVTPQSTGTLTLSYQRNGGDWIAAKSWTVEEDDLFMPKIFQLRKAIRARTFKWRITTTDCMHTVNNFLVRAMPAGVRDDE